MICELCVKIIDRSTYPWLRHERPGRAGELCVLSHRSGCIFPQYKQVTSNTSHTLASPLFGSPYRGDRFARFPFVTLRGLADYTCLRRTTRWYRVVPEQRSFAVLRGGFFTASFQISVSSWLTVRRTGLAADGPQENGGATHGTNLHARLLSTDCSWPGDYWWNQVLLAPSVLDDPRIRVDRRHETLCLTARNRSERQQSSARAVERCSRTTATAGHTCFLIVPVTPPEVPLNHTPTERASSVYRQSRDIIPSTFSLCPARGLSSILSLRRWRVPSKRSQVSHGRGTSPIQDTKN